MLTLYQAEWCPYSSAVRERLTELGVDFVARQVAPRKEDRGEVDVIPTLETESGERHAGTDAAFAFLATLPRARDEHAHRAQYRAEEHERQAERTAQVLREKAPL
jgi:glutathione S-transferase